MDLLGAPRMLPALLRLAQDEAAALGSTRLLTWCSAAFAHWLPAQDRSERDMGVCVPTNIWTQGPAPAELKDQWWLMPGDTDFQ